MGLFVAVGEGIAVWVAVGGAFVAVDVFVAVGGRVVGVGVRVGVDG